MQQLTHTEQASTCIVNMLHLSTKPLPQHFQDKVFERKVADDINKVEFGKSDVEVGASSSFNNSLSSLYTSNDNVSKNGVHSTEGDDKNTWQLNAMADSNQNVGNASINYYNNVTDAVITASHFDEKLKQLSDNELNNYSPDKKEQSNSVGLHKIHLNDADFESRKCTPSDNFSDDVSLQKNCMVKDDSTEFYDLRNFQQYVRQSNLMSAHQFVDATTTDCQLSGDIESLMEQSSCNSLHSYEFDFKENVAQILAKYDGKLSDSNNSNTESTMRLTNVELFLKNHNLHDDNSSSAKLGIGISQDNMPLTESVVSVHKDSIKLFESNNKDKIDAASLYKPSDDALQVQHSNTNKDISSSKLPQSLSTSSHSNSSSSLVDYDNLQKDLNEIQFSLESLKSSKSGSHYSSSSSLTSILSEKKEDPDAKRGMINAGSLFGFDALQSISYSNGDLLPLHISNMVEQRKHVGLGGDANFHPIHTGSIEANDIVFDMANVDALATNKPRTTSSKSSCEKLSFYDPLNEDRTRENTSDNIKDWLASTAITCSRLQDDGDINIKLGYSQSNEQLNTKAVQKTQGNDLFVACKSYRNGSEGNGVLRESTTDTKEILNNTNYGKTGDQSRSIECCETTKFKVYDEHKVIKETDIAPCKVRKYHLDDERKLTENGNQNAVNEIIPEIDDRDFTSLVHNSDNNQETVLTNSDHSAYHSGSFNPSDNQYIVDLNLKDSCVLNDCHLFNSELHQILKQPTMLQPSEAQEHLFDSKHHQVLLNKERLGLNNDESSLSEGIIDKLVLNSSSISHSSLTNGFCISPMPEQSSFNKIHCIQPLLAYQLQNASSSKFDTSNKVANKSYTSGIENCENTPGEQSSQSLLDRCKLHALANGNENVLHLSNGQSKEKQQLVSYVDGKKTNNFHLSGDQLLNLDCKSTAIPSSTTTLSKDHYQKCNTVIENSGVSLSNLKMGDSDVQRLLQTDKWKSFRSISPQLRPYR